MMQNRKGYSELPDGCECKEQERYVLIALSQMSYNNDYNL
jgi:hypothetical protein